MKLNRLVYFAYAERLRAGIQLFDDRLEAWSYGPVVPSVYRAFSTYGKKPIYESTATDVPQEAFLVAKNTWSKYGFLTAYDIMEFSHRPNSVWAAVYTENAQDAPRNVPITDEMILASGDGKDAPQREGTFAEAIDESLVGLHGVLELLADKKVVARAGKKIYDREVSGSENNVERVVHTVMCSRYMDQCGGIIEQAAALTVSLAKGHVFPDGNKRTAAMVLHVFLRKWASGFVLPYPEEEQEENELSKIIQDVAAGKVSADGLADWIEEHITKSSCHKG
ncbi:unnamed protein product [Cylicostephanus goldi]|uniref:Fido domain-containing protein n=1 Tax=Cylicostephanus goldi TaxID=71465 RepID=A0A3P6TIQ4_CYLGO|nr:unnamed protein product [Cylicostephanus goldi]